MKVKTALRIIVKRINIGQISPFFIRSHTILTTEGTQSAFNTDACSTQKHTMLSYHNQSENSNGIFYIVIICHIGHLLM